VQTGSQGETPGTTVVSDSEGEHMAVTKTVSLDMIGTTFSLERLGRKLTEHGATADALPLLFAQTLRDYFASSYAGSYVPLRDVLRAALHRLFVASEIPLS
jgi:hypothetical protein